MKYIAVARGFNEPDNNTPSENILVRVVDIEPSEKEGVEKTFENDLSKSFDNGASVALYELDRLQDGWGEVATIW